MAAATAPSIMGIRLRSKPLSLFRGEGFGVRVRKLSAPCDGAITVCVICEMQHKGASEFLPPPHPSPLPQGGEGENTHHFILKNIYRWECIFSVAAYAASLDISG